MQKEAVEKVLSHKTTSLCEMMANGGNLMAKQKKKLGCWLAMSQMELKSAHLKGSMRGRSKMQKIYIFICQVLISILKMINYSTYAISADSILRW